MSSIKIIFYCDPKATGLVDHKGCLSLHIELSYGKTLYFMTLNFKAEPQDAPIRDLQNYLFVCENIEDLSGDSWAGLGVQPT